MVSILIVEDNLKINKMLSNRCREEGYKVFQAYNAEEGLDLFTRNKIEIVISDLMLPNMSGEELVEQLRKKSECFIVIITAKTQIESKLNGLNIGADDYLVKPFSNEELLLKIKRFLSRSKHLVVNELISFHNGDLIFSSESNIIKVNMIEVKLTAREYTVLKVLIENNSRVLSREQIIKTVFSDCDDVFDRVIDAYIKNIRKKIKKFSNIEYIETVYGLGYKFEGDKDEKR